MIQIETARLILRPWREDDAAALYKYASDPAVGPVAGWSAHTSVDFSRRIINTILSAAETYAVVLKDTGEPVGSVGIMFGDGVHSAAMEDGDAEIGYWIGVPYWGQGLIPEAVRRMLRRCFEELGVKAVWCGYYEGNTRSRRVMEKCGFKFHHTETGKTSPMGDVRTEHFMRMTRDEWKSISNDDAMKSFDIDAWLKRFHSRLSALFGSRLHFLGLQGSYGRGEQTPTSDIDVVVILDEVNFNDLQAYRKMLGTMEHRELICGFVAGEDELRHWEKSDLLQLCLDTRPLFGSLDSCCGPFSDDDIKRAVLIGACNIYHACSHNYLHERDNAMLASLYKTARFTVRMKLYMETGCYVKSMEQLAEKVGPDDRKILDIARDGSKGSLDELSRILMEWASKVMRGNTGPTHKN